MAASRRTSCMKPATARWSNSVAATIEIISSIHGAQSDHVRIVTVLLKVSDPVVRVADGATRSRASYAGCGHGPRRPTQAAGLAVSYPAAMDEPTTPISVPRPSGDSSVDYRQLAVVCVASFVVWAGFGAILPYLPVFLQEEAHASLGLIGIIAAAYYLGTFAFSSPMGALSDRIGRKPVLVLGVCLYAVASLLFITTTQAAWFVLFRLLEGIGVAAVMPASQAFIADITTATTRSRAYGWLTTAQFGGLVAGPALALPLYSLGGGQGKWAFYTIFLFGSIGAALTAVALLLAIREPEHARRRRLDGAERPPVSAAGDPARGRLPRGGGDRELRGGNVGGSLESLAAPPGSVHDLRGPDLDGVQPAHDPSRCGRSPGRSIQPVRPHVFGADRGGDHLGDIWDHP